MIGKLTCNDKNTFKGAAFLGEKIFVNEGDENFKMILLVDTFEFDEVMKAIHNFIGRNFSLSQIQSPTWKELKCKKYGFELEGVKSLDLKSGYHILI